MKVEEGLQIYKHELDMFEACKKYKYKNVKSTSTSTKYKYKINNVHIAYFIFYRFLCTPGLQSTNK